MRGIGMATYPQTYVSVEDALKLIGGYEEIYRKLVHAFIENQRNLISTLDRKWSCDRAEVRRMVHSIKGIAKNLGANPLYQAAIQLESALVEGASDDELLSLYETFKTVFLNTYEELKRFDRE